MQDTIDMARLDEAKRRAGITSDAELARKVGIERAAINKWRGKAAAPTIPSGNIVASLCKVLGVSAPYLFGEDEPARDELAELAARVPPELRAKASEKLRDLLDGYEAARRPGKAPAEISLPNIPPVPTLEEVVEQHRGRRRRGEGAGTPASGK